MTLCYGWIDEHNAYLVGDSAVTCDLSNLNNPVPTSFDEPTSIVKDTAIYEGALKIFSIDSKFCLAIAGNADKAYEYCNWLKENHVNFDSIKELLNAFIKSHTPFSSNQDDFVSLLITVIESEPKLYKWDMENPYQICEGEKFYKIGKVLINFSGLPINLTNLIYNTDQLKEFSNIRKLNISVSVYQSYIVLQESLAQGIGGVVSGVLLDKDGNVKWNIDTSYVVLSGEDKKWTIVGHRGNATAAYSANSGRKNLYLNSDILKDDVDSFYKAIKKELEELILVESSYSWVFIHKNKKRVVIINNKPFYKSDNYITIKSKKISETDTDETLYLNGGFDDYLFHEKTNKFNPIIWLGSPLNMNDTKFDVAILDR